MSIRAHRRRRLALLAKRDLFLINVGERAPYYMNLREFLNLCSMEERVDRHASRRYRRIRVRGRKGQIRVIHGQDPRTMPAWPPAMFMMDEVHRE